MSRYRCTALRRTVILAALAFLMLPGTALAQRNEDARPNVIKNPVVSEPVHARFIDVDLRDLPVREAWKPGDAVKEIPRKHNRRAEVKGAKPTAQRDPLLDLQESADRGFSSPNPTLNWDGQGYSGVNPPDTVGDVGMNYFIQSINGGGGATYVVYNKSDGSVAAGPFSMESLGSGNCASGLGDPIILYDQDAQRWMISEFASGSNTLCVYISQTSDPISGGWYGYAFPTPNFPDYPKYGVWPDAYYVGTNENSSTLYAMDRASMLTGAPATSQSFTVSALSGFGFQMVTPADLDGATLPPANSPGIFMRHRDDEVHSGGTTAGQDFLEIYEFNVDWNNSSNSSLTGPVNIGISEFDSSLCGLTSFSCIDQPNSSTNLDPLREVVMFRLAYRNFGTHEALIGNLATDVNGNDQAGIRWFELRKNGGSWSLYQEGTFAPDSDSRWMAGIAMDGSGNIAMGYNVSSNSTFPSLRGTGRLASDTLGTMPQGEFNIVAGSSPNNSNRYGDYSSLSIDPADDCTFWFTGQYNPAGNWSTRIASFSFDECGCTNPPAAPSGLSAANNGNNRVDLTWGSVSGASEYRVYRADDASCPGSGYSLIATTGSTSYSDTSVSGGVSYAYVVRAYDSGDGCESDASNCDSVVATGACSTAPNFAGVTAVTNLQQSACALQVSWSAGSANCGSALSYNVYRSTASGFTPGAGNRVAACVSGTSYTDTDVSSGTTYYYVVRAEDNTGSCGNGNEDSNVIELSGSPTGPDTVFFNDDMESGAGNWTTAALSADSGTSSWALNTSQANSGTTSWFVSDESSIKDQVVATSSAISLPAGSAGVLSFYHFYNTESTYDGGVLEYSTNGGGTWQDIGSSRITANSYNSTISTSYSSPIGGRSAWSGNSGGFLNTTVDLSDFAGTSINFRWRMACDSSVAATGWWVDDVTVSYGSDCGSTGCSYAISPSSASYGSAGGSGSVSVTADAGCDWTAVSNAAWITVTAGANGSGNGSVSYSVAANGSTGSRNGTVTIAGQTFTVSQSGISCSYAINPTSASYGENGGSGSVGVTANAGCSWSASSNDSWITVTSGASGSGNGTVGYSVAANGSTSARSGSITIAGETFTVNQDGASTGSWVDLIDEDFESGWGVFNDGGSDCRRSANDSFYAHQGTYCVRLRDNTGSISSTFSDPFSLNGYSELRVNFWYYPRSMENFEDFFVELWDGSSWQVIANFARPTDFQNNSFYNPEVIVNSGSVNFSANAQLRIRCDASGNGDYIYVDEVVVSAR